MEFNEIIALLSVVVGVGGLFAVVCYSFHLSAKLHEDEGKVN